MSFGIGFPFSEGAVAGGVISLSPVSFTSLLYGRRDTMQEITISSHKTPFKFLVILGFSNMQEYARKISATSVL